MVNYGSGYLKERIGICKIIEIIVCILILVFLHIHFRSSSRHHYGAVYYFNEYDESLFGLSISGLVFSLLTLICSCIFGGDIEVVLKWLFILWLILFLAFLIVGILAAIYHGALNYLISAICAIVCGIVYIFDTYFSYKDYAPKC